MDENKLNELKNPATWDEGEPRSAVKSPRAVVSVAFSREDFELLAEYARQHNMKTSELIRRAALDFIAPKRPEAIVIAVSGGVRAAHPSAESAQVKTTVTTSPLPLVFATA